MSEMSVKQFTRFHRAGRRWELWRKLAHIRQQLRLGSYSITSRQTVCQNCRRCKRVPRMRRPSRFWLALYVPIAIGMPCQAIVVPPRRFFEEFDSRVGAPGIVFWRGQLLPALRNTFGDVRMLCHDVG
jgi:hypothetical protein